MNVTNMDMETLLLIIELQQLYIKSLNNLKIKNFFVAMEQLEEAYTLFDNVIENIPPKSQIRDYVIELRDLIIFNLKQINDYIYTKEDIDVDSFDFSNEHISNVNYEIPSERGSSIPSESGSSIPSESGPSIPAKSPVELIDYYQYTRKWVNDYFPCCFRYKFKIE